MTYPHHHPFAQQHREAPLLVAAEDGFLGGRRQQREAEDAADVAAVEVEFAGDVLDVLIASGIEGALPDVGSGEGDEEGLLRGYPYISGVSAGAVGYDDLLAAVVPAELHGDAEAADRLIRNRPSRSRADGSSPKSNFWVAKRPSIEAAFRIER